MQASTGSCQPLSPQVASSSSSSGSRVPSSAGVSTAVLRLSANETYSSGCTLTLGQLRLPQNVSACVGFRS